jgi:hypothetical protein
MRAANLPEITTNLPEITANLPEITANLLETTANQTINAHCYAFSLAMA